MPITVFRPKGDVEKHSVKPLPQGCKHTEITHKTSGKIPTLGVLFYTKSVESGSLMTTIFLTGRHSVAKPHEI